MTSIYRPLRYQTGAGGSKVLHRKLEPKSTKPKVGTQFFISVKDEANKLVGYLQSTPVGYKVSPELDKEDATFHFVCRMRLQQCIDGETFSPCAFQNMDSNLFMSRRDGAQLLGSSSRPLDQVTF